MFWQKIKQNGITRFQFLIFLIFWFSIAFILRFMNKQASLPNADTEFAIIVLVISFLHVCILALAVYYRLKNANVNYALAVLCCFIPFLQIAPIISGLWYRTNGDNSPTLIQKIVYFLKNISSSDNYQIVGIAFLIILSALGYINNIIFTIDNWHSFSWFGKAFETISIFFPPLGCFVGIYHFF